LTYDGNPKTKNSIIMHDLFDPNNDDHASEECVLDMLYDNALDDGPTILDDPPCLEIAATTYEDKNDTLDASDDTLIHESSINY
jgi:hypothetical protein